jgi:hypothetical protein
VPQIVAVALCSALAAVCMFGGGMALDAAQLSQAEQAQGGGSSDGSREATYVLGTSELVSETGDEARAANIALTAVSSRYKQTEKQAGSDDAKPAPGVNQVASALYIAALKAGLSVTERHAGTAAADYVSTGLEAVVNPGTADLKVLNTMDSSVVLKAEAQGQKIVVNVVGSASDSSVKYDVVARIVDGDVDSEYTVESYLVTYKDGVKSSEKKLAEGTYTGGSADGGAADAGKAADADEDAGLSAKDGKSADAADKGGSSNSGSSGSGDSSSSSNSGSSTNPVPSRGGTSPVK